ncbi:hypothetical protein [Mucilaginibacter ginsenosidivorans]|uniref:Uncharacterized protein n=1 Tax=Mucilaginibacter ginsenosidivorans TaxID=398053 RepID=A0A5B8UUB9_9SPHI|nr:hypothetical protein [Mucilaginibacter ginsenosidivorans]QEC62478.1 hypothetical protein FRZ54_07720 [Mucilaginibacter ginsenosidivorans]
MDNLLNPFSWSAYLGTLTLLALAYYAFIARKYYSREIIRLIGRIGQRGVTGQQLPDALRYQAGTGADEQAESSTASAGPVQAAAGPRSATDVLARQLTDCIASAAGMAFSPGTLASRLKTILNCYPHIMAAKERAQVNALIVRQCEETGTALLSESEVDTWWDA